MAIYYMYVYAASDFVGGLPAESGWAAAGSPTFTLELLPGAVPTLVAVDDNDAVFDEVDTGQTLDVAANVGGTTHAAGTTIVTSYDLTNGPTGHKVSGVHFGISGNSQGPVDGLTSTVLLVPGVPYTFTGERTSHNQNNQYSDYVACFVTGTRLKTPTGFAKVEDIRAGDLLCTLDSGDLPVEWVGQRTVSGTGALAPIRIPAGWNGLKRSLMVSPQHRMMIEGAACELAAACDSALLSARQLEQMGLAEAVPCAQVTYHHVMFASHQIVIAEGAPSESLMVNEDSVKCFADEASREILELFPDLVQMPMAPARPVLRAHEACFALG